MALHVKDPSDNPSDMVFHKDSAQTYTSQSSRISRNTDQTQAAEHNELSCSKAPQACLQDYNKVIHLHKQVHIFESFMINA